MRHYRRSFGQSLVEFALIAPIFIVLCMGALDLGRIYFAHVALVGAVEQGAKVAALKPYSTDLDVKAAVTSEFPAAVNVKVDPVTAPNGMRSRGAPVTVTADTVFSLVTPVMTTIVGDDKITLHATASMAVQ